MPQLSPTAAASRQIFIDAFCELYQDKPTEKVTVAELTRKAGFNRSTFYEYFTDVNDLLTQLEDEYIAHVREELTGLTSPEHIADAFIASFSALQERTKSYTPVLLSSKHVAKFTDRLKTSLMPVIHSQFNISEHETRNIYMLEFYLAGVIAVVSKWLQDGRETPVSEMGAIIRALTAEAIVNMKQ
ncbi:MAG: TetR/AcrR family transcriptional regulator [Oscillospiraceae bacterium]|nr:TetR/AcrR family transcriptional regulator [Oscillospiraceae bacterium]